MIAMPGREDRIKIIYDEWEERDYEDPSRCATIDRCIYSGASDKVKGSSRLGHDRYVLGKGYLGSALMILFPLVRDENYHEAGDVLILPVMNVIREGLEHWFKSSLILLASIYKTEYPAGDDRIYDPDPNEIYGLYDDFWDFYTKR